MNTFAEIIHEYDWEKLRNSIYSKTSMDVKKSLEKDKLDLEDFKALLSPAAADHLEHMAYLSNKKTLKRFGKTMQMYIPLYLSNVCQNTCTYCGFSAKNHIQRNVLSPEEVLDEVKAIKKMGFDHLLLVTGEASHKVGIEYFKEIMKMVRPYFAQISMEVQPLEENEYKELISLGLTNVYIYQETYNSKNYNLYHPSGKKADFKYRLETPDRLGRAKIYKIGLGVLLGLEDWRTDSFFTGIHLRYLQKRYWQTKYCISFPRIRPAEGISSPSILVSEKELVQLICAYRLFDEDLELSLSTRESSIFRNHALKLGITSFSAGSKTYPGGYAKVNPTLEQFEVGDNRSPREIAALIRSQGYEVVWKDWDPVLQ
ncbi:MAG: 2-iminoacetate synthase ThiH [bacterium]